MSLDFIALDFETANQKRGSVIQLGIAKVINGEVRKTSTVFITPPPGLERFDWQCVRVHGIKVQDVIGAPTWPEILERIIKFAGPLPLVGHNVSVERSCIVQASEAHGIVSPDFPYWCSLRMAKRVFPGEPSHSLGKLTASLGLPAFAHHDAGEDAIASAALTLLMAERLGVSSIEEMSHGWAPATAARQAA